MAVGQAVAEPFGGLALVHLHRDGFTEKAAASPRCRRRAATTISAIRR
ncbi:hypothetical protein [Rhodopseudomonas palustris]